MISISNSYLGVTIEEKGAELLSVYSKTFGKELLYDAKGVWPHHDVVLFPFIGPDKAYGCEGVSYHCPTQHGFARNLTFQVISQSNDSVSLAIEDTPETFAYYPYHFRFVATYSLVGEAVSRHYLVENRSHKSLPFSLGDHAAYRALFGKAVLHLGAKPLTYLPRPSFVLQAPIPFEKAGDVLLMKKDFEQYETIVLTNPGEPLSLSNGYGVRLTYHFTSPYIAIWSPSVSADFLCVEPWWGLAPYAGMPYEVRERKAMNLVEGSKTFEEQISFSKD